MQPKEDTNAKRGTKDLDDEDLDEASYNDLTLSTKHDAIYGSTMSMLDKNILNKEVITKGDDGFEKNYLSMTNRAKKKEVLKKKKMQRKDRLKYYHHLSKPLWGAKFISRRKIL